MTSCSLRSFAQAAAIALLFAATACANGVVPTGTVDATPTDTQRPSPCADASVAFWGLEGPAQHNWTTDSVRLGYHLSADALLVAFEGDEVIGWEHVEVRGGRAIEADGDVLQLERALAGQHTVRVVVYRDVDADGTFDAGLDEPCSLAGEPIQAGPETIDFDRFDS